MIAAALRRARPRVRRPAAGDVRRRALGRAAPPARARPRPLRHQAALLVGRGGGPGLRLRAQRPAAPTRGAQRDRPRCAGGVPRLQQRPRALDASTGPPGSSRRGTCWSPRTGRVRLERFARPAPGRRGLAAPRPVRRRSPRSCDRAAPRLRARASRRRRAGRRAALRRRRLLALLTALAAEEARRATLHLLDRLRGALVRRARPRRRDRPALRHGPPRARGRAGRRRAAAGDRRRLRRAVRRLERPPHVPREPRSPRATSRSSSRARAATSCSAGTRRTWPTCSRRGSAASPGSPSRSSSGCRARRAGSRLDYRLKRFARTAHLPPLDAHHGWKEIFSADARAELLHGRRGADPLGRSARALRRDGGGAGPGPPPGRRPRHLPRRRPPRQDRPHEHGPLARGPRAVPRRRGRRPRAGPADDGQGALPAEEAPAARGGRAARGPPQSPVAASAASRSRPRPGCADPSSRSPARSSRPPRSPAGVCSIPPP